MMNSRLMSLTLGALVALFVVVLASAAYSATAIHYRGMTSQQGRISFTISGGYLRNLQYRIDDRCPGGKVLFVHDYGFPIIPITHSRSGGKLGSRSGGKSSGKFEGSFVARRGVATARLQGKTSGKVVTGSLFDRAENAKTRKICTGRATFRLTHK